MACADPADENRFSIRNVSAARVKHGFNATRGCCGRTYRGTIMIRKLLLPALAVAMLGGCVTSGYEYRGGNGDYYYGQPQVEYRDYGYPYGRFGYGYPGGWSGSFGWGYGYGDPYGYYGGYYDPWRYYTPYRRPHHRDHHGDHDHDDSAGVPPTTPRDDGDHRPPPWRDFIRVPPPGTRPPPVPQQRRDYVAPTLRPMPRMDDQPTVTRDDRREERREIRREPERTQVRREPDRDLRRKHEP
jgi:hypothetical protein